MRKKRLTAIILTGLLIVMSFAKSAGAGEILAVIVNKANPVESLSQTDIKKIYVNTTLNWPDDTPIIIFDLSIADPLRAAFSERILGKSPDKVAEEWAHLKITNEAKNPPITVKSQSLIIRKVANEKGAIGYVSLTVLRNYQGMVKIVYTFMQEN